MLLSKKFSFLLILCVSVLTFVSCINKDVESPVPQSNNKPPVATAGADKVIVLPVNTVKLDGSTSKDPDGQITKYEWVKIDGPATFKIETPTKDTTTVSGLTEGMYSFKLIVADNKGLTNSDTVKVIVNKAGAKPPVANAGQDQTITLPTNMVTLDGSLSRDQVGSTDLAYKWEYLPGGPNTPVIATPDKATTQVSVLIEGVYTFQLTVTQNGGLMNSTTVKITVNKAGTNQIPIAKAIATPDNITLPTNVITLNGAASSDADGDALTYKWTKQTAPTGDASNITNDGQNITTVTGLIAGNYSFQLTVDDGKGGKNSTIVKVTVITPLPIASTTGTVTNVTLDDGMPLEALTLDGSYSKDYDGSAVTKFNWEEVNGPAATITNTSASKTTVTGLQPGNYTFKLTVTTSDGRTNSTMVSVTVATINGIWEGKITLSGSIVTLNLNLKSATSSDNILVFDNPDDHLNTSLFGTYTLSTMGGKLTITGDFGTPTEKYTFTGDFSNDRMVLQNLILKYKDRLGKSVSQTFPMLKNTSL